MDNIKETLTTVIKYLILTNFYLLKVYFIFTAKVVFTNNNEFFRFINNQILIDFGMEFNKNIFKYDKSSSKLISAFAPQDKP